jgi:hypothetical protein
MEATMPLLKFHIHEGRTEAEIATLLDVTHKVVVDVFEVPVGDRYQIVTEHKNGRFVAHDTGLGIDRTDKLVLLEIVSRPRGEQKKQAFYAALAKALEAECGIAPSDLIVSVVDNGDADWSFGHGRAQFKTGEL